MDRHQILPALRRPGASSLRILVRDLNATAVAVKAAGFTTITAGGSALAVQLRLD